MRASLALNDGVHAVVDDLIGRRRPLAFVSSSRVLLERSRWTPGPQRPQDVCETEYHWGRSRQPSRRERFPRNLDSVARRCPALPPLGEPGCRIEDSRHRSSHSRHPSPAEHRFGHASALQSEPGEDRGASQNPGPAQRLWRERIELPPRICVYPYLCLPMLVRCVTMPRLIRHLSLRSAV
jgi:hypothetical protein